MTRIAFATCVTLGHSCLHTLVANGVTVDLAITLPDDRAINKSGRVFLDTYCQDHGIELIKSKNINDSAVISAVRAHQIDVLFVIGWSQIVRPELLGAPAIGAFGIHPTLLPTGRGRAAIPWAIIKELDQTGVTLFKIDEGVDTGPVVDQFSIPLTRSTTATDLYDLANEAHITLMERNIPSFLSGDIAMHAQDNASATIWPGRKPEDGNLHSCENAVTAECLVRATTHPYPGAFFFDKGNKITVWSSIISEDIPRQLPYLRFSDGVLVATDYKLTSAA